ncbi:hypothetical protein AXG93_48s1060 [Marchantia polymorpha subsp. ruderalis]|uniref:Uncharacterized protein n=1 Tax=Marchantia polymorpha subsp. ruderalis TaxID=1480154 RepID=A0A176VVB8_MARPO|nr:hypothetical protein AXG93_48s1060 [Marchantia polymorpha subsp. ruderalis]
MTHFRARASLLPTQTLQSALDFFSPKALEGEMQRRGREGGRSGGLTSLTIAGAARVAPCHGVCTMSSTGFVRLHQSSVMRSLIFSRIPVSKLPIEAHLYHISKPRRLKRLCLELGRDESTRARNFGEIRGSLTAKSATTRHPNSRPRRHFMPRCCRMPASAGGATKRELPSAQLSAPPVARLVDGPALPAP